MNESIRWEITNNCNLCCEHCAVSEVSSCDMSFEKAKEIVNRLVESGVKEILFSTKEPFAYQYIWELLEYCSISGIYSKIVTNGTLLTEEKVKRLFKFKIKYISISMDGWTAEDNDAIRGNGTFELINRAISLFCKYNSDPDYSYIPIYVQTIINEYNLRHVEKLEDLCERYPDVVFSLAPLVWLGNAKTNKYISAEKRWKERKKDVFDIIRKKGRQVFFRENSYYESIVNNFLYGLNQMPLIPSCNSRAHDYFTIMPSGELCKCMMLLDSSVKVPFRVMYGDILSEPKNIMDDVTEDYSFKDNQTCRSCSIREECSMCYAIVYSEESLAEQIEKCRTGQTEYMLLLDQIEQGKIKARINSELILSENHIDVILKTGVTKRIGSLSERNIMFIGKNYDALSIDPGSISQLSREDIEELLANNIIRRADG